jgi:hypothetical protein
MSRRENTTYLYVREGPRPQAVPLRSERPHLPPPVEPARPASRQPPVRLVRPVTSAAAIDARFALLFMPDSEAAAAYRSIAEQLQALRPGGGRVAFTALDRSVARTRTALNVAAALTESAGFAVLVDLDPGSGALAATLGVQSFPGLRAQAEARERDARRPLDLLHVARRVGALPLEADGRLPTPTALASTLATLDSVATWTFLDAAPQAAVGLADAVVVVVSPAQAQSGRAALEEALPGLPIIGVVVAVG